MIVHLIIDPTFWGDPEESESRVDWFPGFFVAGSGTHFRISWNQKATFKNWGPKRSGMVRSRGFFDQITWKLMIIMVTDPSEIEWMIGGKFIHSRHSKSRTIIEKKHKKTLTYIRPVSLSSKNRSQNSCSSISLSHTFWEFPGVLGFLSFGGFLDLQSLTWWPPSFRNGRYFFILLMVQKSCKLTSWGWFVIPLFTTSFFISQVVFNAGFLNHQQYPCHFPPVDF